jgi:hypothetical protein
VTLEELIAAAADIERALEDRVEIWVQIVEPDGALAERIYRGSFRPSRKEDR